jgi:hypothetical protein
VDTNVLKSYLVSLGFSVDHPQLRKYEDALRTVGQQAEKLTTGMAKQFTVAGTAIVGTLTGIATGVLALADSAAGADLQFQLFARRMFMTTDAARSMKIAADALGVSIEDIVWGPKELQERYQKLVQEQKQIEGGFGGSTEQRLRQIRDLRFEFTRLEVAATELSRGFAVDLFTKLFGGTDAQKRLTEFVDHVINVLPRIATELADALAPTLKNVWAIWRDLGEVAKEVTSSFLQFVGAVYGDGQLEKGEVTIRNIGAALEHISGTVRELVGYLRWIIDAIANHPVIAKTLGGALAGGALGSIVPGVGTGAGAAIGGAAGLIAGAGTAMGAFSGSDDKGFEARKIAREISAMTGIPAALLYGQFAHETGNFSHFGAANNYAGINIPGGKGQDYRAFDSPEAFENYYSGLIKRRYPSALGARTPEDFARALKEGGYYGDSYENYSKGIRNWAGKYSPTSGSGSIDVGGVTVNISEPHATPEQIYKAAVKATTDVMTRQQQRNLIQLNGSYA